MSVRYFSLKSLKSKSDCQRISVEYQDKKYLNKGAYGSVSSICNRRTKNCNYVLKVITFNKELYQLGGEQPTKSRAYIKKEWKNEIKIMQEICRYQESISMKFIPNIVDYWFCDFEGKDITEFYIVMEKFDGDLFMLMNDRNYSTEVKELVLAKFQSLKLVLHLIHIECDICLNDIKLENILYKQIGPYEFECVFADLGKSNFQTNLNCKKDDLERFDRTIENFKNSL